MAEPPFIVAEVTRTWTEAEAPADLISGKLEHVIAHNLQRGYVLYSFSHSQVFIPARQLLDGRQVGAHQQETIIAVFRRDDAAARQKQRETCAFGEHNFEVNYGMNDSTHPYCTRCGVAK